MEEIYKNIIEKDHNLKLIDISHHDILDSINHIKDISSDPDKSQEVLYYMSEKVSIQDRCFYQFGFNIPTDDKLIVLFHKGDYQFFNVSSNLNADDNKMVIRKFLNRASFETKIVCLICCEEKEHMINCKKCAESFCQSCHAEFKKNECPFCKTEITFNT